MFSSAIVEGKDSHSNLEDIYASFKIQVINEIVAYTKPKLGGVVYPTRTTPVRFWGGGDMAFTSEVLGLGSHYNRKGFNCCWCEVHTDSLAVKSSSTNRTLKRLYNLAHLPVPHKTVIGEGHPHEESFPFTCPGCQRVFASAEVRKVEILCTCFQLRMFWKYLC